MAHHWYILHYTLQGDRYHNEDSVWNHIEYIISIMKVQRLPLHLHNARSPAMIVGIHEYSQFSMTPTQTTAASTYFFSGAKDVAENDHAF